MKKIFIGIILSIIMVSQAAAQLGGSGTLADPYYGSISTAVTWDLSGFPGGIVYVGKAGVPATTYNDVTVTTGGHLTVGAGMTVIFLVTTSDLIITSSGILTAHGNSPSQIIFTKGSSISHWGHITFEVPGTSTPITGTGSFKYCKVEYGYANGAFPNPNSTGGGIQINAPNVTIENCYFNNNYATFGGAVTVNANQNTTVRNSFFKSNNANECAGALLLYLNTSAIVENCIFESNNCTGATQTYYGGGAIWTRQNTSKIVNCTFVKNTSPRAGDALYSYNSSTSKIVNSIFWGSNDQFATTGTAAAISNCAFETIKPATAVNSIIINSVNSNPAGPNFYATDGTNWAIKFVSPCLDAGTDTYTGVTIPLTDYIGNARVWTTDMGAYEAQYSRWKGPGTSWSTSGNWVNGMVPTSTSDILIPSGISSYPDDNVSPPDVTVGAGQILDIYPGTRVTMNSLLNYGTLKLRSSATGIASLLMDSYSPVDAGTEEIQLYLAGGGSVGTYKWHYISVPVPSVSTTVFTTLDLAQYLEKNVSTDQNTGWVAYDGWVYYPLPSHYYSGPADPDYYFTTLDLGKGYTHYSSVNKLYTFSGQINCSELTGYQLVYNSGGYTEKKSAHGFNLIGNPFTCSLDWSVIDDNLDPVISKAIYYTHNNQSASWINGVGAGGGTNIIPPMQAFFVKTNADGKSITLPINARVHSAQARYKGMAEIIPLVRLTLLRDTMFNDAVVRFDNLATIKTDNNFDAYKLSGGNGPVSIWTKTDGVDYSINGLPFPDTYTEIPVLINSSAAGDFKITASELQGLDSYDVTLTDKLNNITINLRTTPELSFSAASGLTGDRFVIKVSTILTAIPEVVPANIDFNIYSGNGMINIQLLGDSWNGITGDISILDLTGRTFIMERKNQFNKGDLKQIPVNFQKGIYIVEITATGKRYVGKVAVR